MLAEFTVYQPAATEFGIMDLIILVAAFGFGPMSDSAMHAPRWLIGIVFLGGGIMLFDTFHKLAGLMAGVATVGMTARSMRFLLSPHPAALKNQIFLSEKSFVERRQSEIKAESVDLKEFPKAQRRSLGRPFSFYIIL